MCWQVSYFTYGLTSYLQNKKIEDFGVTILMLKSLIVTHTDFPPFKPVISWLRGAVVADWFRHWTSIPEIPGSTHGQAALSSLPSHSEKTLTLKRPGGGGWFNPPSTFSATIPPREIFWPRRSLTFYFQVSRILWHHFRENRAYRYDAARPFIQARQTKNGSKTWFCVQSQCKWSFLTLFIKIWLFSLSLAEINSF